MRHITVGTIKQIINKIKTVDMASQKEENIKDLVANSDQEESYAKMSKALSNKLSNLNLKVPSLSSVAMKGDEKLVTSFLTETMNVTGDSDQVKQSQLYIAAFWGFVDVLKTLIDSGCDVNHQNEGSLWTPLHAAAFQEHGKVVMLLLQHKANPELEDSVKRTPKDFASASLKIWPHFAALGYSRTSKQDLIDKGIICKIDLEQKDSLRSASSKMHAYRPAAFNRPGSSYIIQNPLIGSPSDVAGAHERCTSGLTRRGQKMDSRAMAACLSGDVLAGSPQDQLRPSDKTKKIQLGIWRAS